MGAGYTFAMPVDRIRRPACFLCALCVLWIALAGASLMAQSSVAEWRAAHERQIIDELMTFVGLPNVAGNDADMRKNAELAAALRLRSPLNEPCVGSAPHGGISRESTFDLIDFAHGRTS